MECAVNPYREEVAGNRRTKNKPQPVQCSHIRGRSYRMAIGEQLRERQRACWFLSSSGDLK